jgi:hypothetical protein
LHSTGSDAPAIQEDESTAAKPARAEVKSHQCEWEIRRRKAGTGKELRAPMRSQRNRVELKEPSKTES